MEKNNTESISIIAKREVYNLYIIIHYKEANWVMLIINEMPSKEPGYQLQIFTGITIVFLITDFSALNFTQNSSITDIKFILNSFVKSMNLDSILLKYRIGYIINANLILSLISKCVFSFINNAELNEKSRAGVMKTRVQENFEVPLARDLRV